MTLYSEYDGQKFTIFSISGLNSRALTKIKLFLNSKNNIKYNMNDNLEIVFNTKDVTLISKESINLINYIERTLNCKVKLDEELSNATRQTENNEKQFRNLITTLKELKTKELGQDFSNYVQFCNSTLCCKLRPYQFTASYFLTLGMGGFDFSVPGSGKTIISYASYNYFKHKSICDSVLIVGPLNSFNAWYDEYITCFNKSPDFFSLATLTKNEAITYLLASQKNHSEITFVNVDKAWRLKNEIIEFLDGKNTLLIIDEAHKEKNPDAEITKAIMEITKYSKCRILLTGTPMPNGYEDLYSLTKIYSPYEKLIRYSFSDLKKMSKYGANTIEKTLLMESIKPFYSRVSKKHLILTGELQPPQEHYIYCTLTPEQESVYEFLDKLSYTIDNDFESAYNVALMKAILIRKMQISANPGLLSKSIVNTIDKYRSEYAQESEDDTFNELLIRADSQLKILLGKSKIATIVNQFESGYLTPVKNLKAVELAMRLVSEGKKVIIWDVFVQNMYAIKKLVERNLNVDIELINGFITGDARQQAINNFRLGKSMILIANPSTLAESLSLHKCCQHAIYVNRNFNGAQFIQSKDRIHRINMPKGTISNYYYLLNEGTIDTYVDERLKVKEQRMIDILDADELKVGGAELESNSFISLDDILNISKDRK